MANKPDNADEILEVMKEYNIKRGFNLSESCLSYLAEDMFLHFEGKGWVGVKYYPAIAMKWILNHVTKFGTKIKQIDKPKQEPKQGPSVREQLLNDI